MPGLRVKVEGVPLLPSRAPFSERFEDAVDQACEHAAPRQKFITVLSNSETAEPLWFGQDRSQATLDRYFKTEMTPEERLGFVAASVDKWEPLTKSILSWVPTCRIVFDKFPVMQHANRAVDEIRRAEFFRKSEQKRQVVTGKRWLLLTRWVNLEPSGRPMLTELFALNRRVMKAYLLKESLDRLCTYTYEGAAR